MKLFRTWTSREPTEGSPIPIAKPLSLQLYVGASVTFSLPVVDPQGDTLTYTIVTSPTIGTLTNNGSGSYTYTSSGSAGSDSFTYYVSDGANDSTTETVSITVDTGNDARTIFSMVPPANHESIIIPDFRSSAEIRKVSVGLTLSAATYTTV